MNRPTGRVGGKTGAKQDRAAFPRRGEIWQITSEPRTGHEIQKRRPALVLSDTDFNSLGPMVALVPISLGQGPIAYRDFRVPVPEGLQTSGWALASQLKFLDWTARDGQRIEEAPGFFVEEVAALAGALLAVG